MKKNVLQEKIITLTQVTQAIFDNFILIVFLVYNRPFEN